MRLQDDDYLIIYPYANPEEIKEEFSYRAHCTASIRQRYRNLQIKTPYKAKRELRNKLQKDKPKGTKLLDWERTVDKELENKKLEAFAEVWKRVYVREDMYRKKRNA